MSDKTGLVLGSDHDNKLKFLRDAETTVAPASRIGWRRK